MCTGRCWTRPLPRPRDAEMTEGILGARLLDRCLITMNATEVGLQYDEGCAIEATDEGDGTLTSPAGDDEPVGGHSADRVAWRRGIAQSRPGGSHGTMFVVQRRPSGLTSAARPRRPLNLGSPVLTPGVCRR
jgi:hypothetical protein